MVEHWLRSPSFFWCQVKPNVDYSRFERLVKDTEAEASQTSKVFLVKSDACGVWGPVLGSSYQSPTVIPCYTYCMLYIVVHCYTLSILFLFFPPPRGQETKQELPRDLALPIFSLMQKASVCFSPVVDLRYPYNLWLCADLKLYLKPMPKLLNQSIQLVTRSTIFSEILPGSGDLCGGVWSQGLEQRGTKNSLSTEALHGELQNEQRTARLLRLWMESMSWMAR